MSPFVAGLNDPRVTFTGEFLVATDTTRVWIIDEQGNKRVLAEAAAFPIRSSSSTTRPPSGAGSRSW